MCDAEQCEGAEKSMGCQACVAWSELGRVRYAPQKARGGPAADRLLHVELQMSRPCVARSQRLVSVVAIDLLPEGLGVERVDSTGDAGDDRKRILTV